MKKKISNFLIDDSNTDIFVYFPKMTKYIPNKKPVQVHALTIMYYNIKRQHKISMITFIITKIFNLYNQSNSFENFEYKNH